MKRRKFFKVGAIGSASMVITPYFFRGYKNTPVKNSSSDTDTDININIKISPWKAIISNQKLKKIISYSDQQPMPVQVASLFDKEENKELLTGRQQSWFEFVINSRLVKSSERLWQYYDHGIRVLGNGGKELLLVFQGAQSSIEGLQVHIEQQVFPGSSLMREQLTLKSISGNEFYINKKEDKLHFVFPQYDIKTDKKAQLTSTEFRMATWGKGILDDVNSAASYDSRGWDDAGDQNLAMAHMFHPDIRTKKLEAEKEVDAKGPIVISSCMSGDEHFLMAYEHASQDNIVDFDFSKTNEVHPALQFFSLRHHRTLRGLSLSVNMIRGGYIDGEKIHNKRPYQSVWAATGFYKGKGLGPGKNMIHAYLLKWIVEEPASRELSFYYNTWGMQRDEQSQGGDVRAVMNTGRILKEIEYASKLGVDLFVLDDGWEQNQGIWKPHKKRLQEGLKPVREALEKRNMRMGVWLSPLGIAKGTPRYQEHPDWLIKDEKGKPILGQWDHPVFCMVSDFYDQFIEDCKKLIDQGVRFFKWDALNTFRCTSPSHHHGGEQHSEKERADNYAYLFPIYVKKAMAELTAYEPNLIIEIDLTENRRAVVGLAPLSKGKLFWMNNGASWYGDYSTYRAKSMKRIPHEFAGWFPLDVFTYANYPHNKFPYFAQRYNVNSSLAAGRGFWGNLTEMSTEQLSRVNNAVKKGRDVFPYIRNTMTEVAGRVGASPEIYERVNAEESAGQVIGFSGSACKCNHQIKLDRQNFLAVAGNSYELKDGVLNLYFQFLMADSSREAFIYSNEGAGIRIIRSTSWLDNIELKHSMRLSYTAGAAGKQDIIWPKEIGKPNISSPNIEVEWTSMNEYYQLTIESAVAGERIKLF